MMTSNFNFDSLLSFIDLQIDDLKIQTTSSLIQTCPQTKKISKNKHPNRRYRYYYREDSELKEVEQNREKIVINPFTNYLNEEPIEKEFKILNTPIKKMTKANFDSLITKKKKRTIKSNEKSKILEVSKNLFKESLFVKLTPSNKSNEETEESE